MSTPPRGLSQERLGLLFSLSWTALVVSAVAAWVDLTPKVESDFFFAEDDPQLAESRSIGETFPQGETVLIRIEANEEFAGTGLGQLSSQLGEIEGVSGVYSAATEDTGSPLWSRILVGGDGASGYVFLTLEDIDPAQFLDEINQVLDQHRQEGVRLTASGVPVIVEQIRRALRLDLVVFSSVAFVLFGLMITVIYRNPWIVVGSLSACVAGCGTTLILLHLGGIQVGLLTANILTIVFVLTLSHVVFIVGNWTLQGQGDREHDRGAAARNAVQATVNPSLWCLTTTALGFASLWLTTAKPLQELGTAGSLGALVAFASAFLLLPPFLAQTAPRQAQHGATRLSLPWTGMRFAIGFAAVVVVLGFGVRNLDTDPSLLTYFDPDGEIFLGLDEIDRDGGSSPYLLVVQDPAGNRLDTQQAYDQLWRLQDSLEADPAAGVVLSPAPLIAHARTQPLAGFLPIPMLIALLDQPAFGAFTRAVMTPEKDKVLFTIRIRESYRESTRQQTMTRLQSYASAAGLSVTDSGGLYDLQHRLAELIRQSLAWGLAGLLSLFLIIAWIVSRNATTSAFMSLSLVAIPLTVLGGLAYAGIAVDIITSPAANVALAMGVDSLIHLVTRARRLSTGSATANSPWRTARNDIAGPVLAATGTIGLGFSVFLLSGFPPTRRFGVAVTLGTATAALVTLFLLPGLMAALRSTPDQGDGQAA